jgi:hypothetical protein
VGSGVLVHEYWLPDVILSEVEASHILFVVPQGSAAASALVPSHPTTKTLVLLSEGLRSPTAKSAAEGAAFGQSRPLLHSPNGVVSQNGQ